MLTTALQNVDGYLEVFPRFERSAAGHEIAWLRNLRNEAFSRFCETGFPTTHDEDWRFTNVASIAHTQFHLSHENSTISRRDLERWAFGAAKAQMVFVD